MGERCAFKPALDSLAPSLSFGRPAEMMKERPLGPSDTQLAPLDLFRPGAGRPRARALIN